MALAMLRFLSLLLFNPFVACILATQIVLLDRPSDSPTYEPFFTPKSVNADVGETVQFVAAFEPLSSVRTPLSSH